LNNLVTNAADFSPLHGVITIRLSKKDNRYELSVEDEGPGINEEDRKRLFERFYSRKRSGRRIGLTIVQTIADRLGSQIRLENRMPVGLCATLEICRL
jgi:two-component system sensor histidine kinase QseC